MAVGSTGFSKREIEALMANIPHPDALKYDRVWEDYLAAYNKLAAVHQRLMDAQVWKETRGW